MCVCSRSHGQPFGARNRACSFTSFSNHSPAVARFAFARSGAFVRTRFDTFFDRFISLQKIQHL
jgi:hypothetical protein